MCGWLCIYMSVISHFKVIKDLYEQYWWFDIGEWVSKLKTNWGSSVIKICTAITRRCIIFRIWNNMVDYVSKSICFDVQLHFNIQLQVRTKTWMHAKSAKSSDRARRLKRVAKNTSIYTQHIENQIFPTYRQGIVVIVYDMRDGTI